MGILIAILIVVVVAEAECGFRARQERVRGGTTLLWAALGQIVLPPAIVLGFLLWEDILPEAKQPGSWWLSPREGLVMMTLFWSQIAVMALGLGLTVWVGRALRRNRREQPTSECTLSAGAAES